MRIGCTICARSSSCNSPAKCDSPQAPPHACFSSQVAQEKPPQDGVRGAGGGGVAKFETYTLRCSMQAPQTVRFADQARGQAEKDCSGNACNLVAAFGAHAVLAGSDGVGQLGMLNLDSFCL